jgi:hypothetical protein
MASQAVSREGENATAVVAHGLLTSMAVVSAAVMTVWEHWADLSPAKRDYLFERILAHSDFVSEALRDLTQGLPEGVAAELAEMQRRRPLRRGDQWQSADAP